MREREKEKEIIINDLTIPPPNQKSKQTLSLFLFFTEQSAREIACITLLFLLKLNGLHNKANIACTKVTHILQYTLKTIYGWSQMAIHKLIRVKLWPFTG